MQLTGQLFSYTPVHSSMYVDQSVTIIIVHFSDHYQHVATQLASDVGSTDKTCTLVAKVATNNPGSSSNVGKSGNHANTAWQQQ